jgi:RimJ/RimL family protein N-acetyltransferase
VIEGDLVYLTTRDPANLETTRAWVNDRSVARWFIDELVPQSSKKFRKVWEEFEESGKAQAFEMHVKEDDRFIGMVGLWDIDLRHRNAELGIFIGPEKERGRGYGRDALLTVMRFGFDTLGLHSIFLGAIDDNERGIGLYRSLGFKDSFRVREAMIVDGRHHDGIVFDMLDREFYERYGTSG